MIRICSVVLLAVQLIFVQCDEPDEDVKTFLDNVPRNCWHPPREVNPHDCCPIPPAYSEEEFAACGIQKPPGPPNGERPSGPPPNGGPPGPPRGKHGPHGRPDCSKTLCLMKNSGQLNDDETVNFDMVANFTDFWAKSNPDFTEAISIAKEKCITDKSALTNKRFPPDMCDADKIMLCMTSNVFWNCKLKEDVAQCAVLKNHIEECKEYFE